MKILILQYSTKLRSDYDKADNTLASETMSSSLTL